MGECTHAYIYERIYMLIFSLELPSSELGCPQQPRVSLSQHPTKQVRKWVWHMFHRGPCVDLGFHNTPLSPWPIEPWKSLSNVAWRHHWTFSKGAYLLRYAGSPLTPFLAPQRHLKGHPWCISAFGVLQTYLGGCHRGVKGRCLLQVSIGASMQHITSISSVQEAIRMSYSQFYSLIRRVLIPRWRGCPLRTSILI